MLQCSTTCGGGTRQRMVVCQQGTLQVSSDLPLQLYGFLLGLPLRTYMVKRYLLYVHLLKTHDISFFYPNSFDIWPVLLAHLLLHIFPHLFHKMQEKRFDRSRRGSTKNSNRGTLIQISLSNSLGTVLVLDPDQLATRASQCPDPANGADLTGSGSTTQHDKCLRLVD